MANIMESDLPVGDGLDQSSTSQPEGVQQSSPGGVGLEAVMERLGKIESSLEAERRDQQSKKDRGIAATNKKLSEVQSQIAKIQGYLAKYPDPEVAARWMAFDDLFGGEERQEPVSQVPAGSPQVGGAPPATPGTIDPEILALLGVDPKDPYYVAEMAGGKSPLEAAKTVAKAIRQGATPNPAGIQPTGASAATATQKAALQDAYDKEIAKVRRGDWTAITAVKEKYRKKGLEVW